MQTNTPVHSLFLTVESWLSAHALYQHQVYRNSETKTTALQLIPAILFSAFKHFSLRSHRLWAELLGKTRIRFGLALRIVFINRKKNCGRHSAYGALFYWLPWRQRSWLFQAQDSKLIHDHKCRNVISGCHCHGIPSRNPASIIQIFSARSHWVELRGIMIPTAMCWSANLLYMPCYENDQTTIMVSCSNVHQRKSLMTQIPAWWRIQQFLGKLEMPIFN